MPITDLTEEEETDPTQYSLSLIKSNDNIIRPIEDLYELLIRNITGDEIPSSGWVSRGRSSARIGWSLASYRCHCCVKKVPEIRREVDDGDALVREEADFGVRLVCLCRGMILEEDLDLELRARTVATLLALEICVVEERGHQQYEKL